MDPSSIYLPPYWRSCDVFFFSVISQTSTFDNVFQASFLLFWKECVKITFYSLFSIKVADLGVSAVQRKSPVTHFCSLRRGSPA